MRDSKRKKNILAAGMLLLVFCVAQMVGMNVGAKNALAAEKNISLSLGTSSEISIMAGDTGRFSVEAPDEKSLWFEAYQHTESVEYTIYDEDVITVDTLGNYTTVANGLEYLYVTGYDSLHIQTYQFCYALRVAPDMTNVSLASDTAVVYQTGYKYYNGNQNKIAINGAASDFTKSDLSCTSAVTGAGIVCTLDNNALVFSGTRAVTSDVTVTLCGKSFLVHVTIYNVKINTSSLLIVKGKTKQFKISGIEEAQVVNWKASNSNVKISTGGKLTAKKVGASVITASFNGCKVGCVVSVVTATRKKVIACAEKIGDTCKYSQPKRMRAGYYDCSSLVWRAYSRYGTKFGAAHYAPTAAGIASYLNRHHKLLSGGFSVKNLQNRKIKSGSLFFRTGAKNGRYKGIYHVEMFIGYTFEGYDSKGNTVVGSKWANRTDNYYSPGAGAIGQM